MIEKTETSALSPAVIARLVFLRKKQKLRSLSILATNIFLLKALYQELSRAVLSQNPADHFDGIQRKINDLVTSGSDAISEHYQRKLVSEVLSPEMCDEISTQLEAEKTKYKDLFSSFMTRHTPNFLSLLMMFRLDKDLIFEEMLKLPEGEESDLNAYYLNKFLSFSEQKDDEIESIIIASQRQLTKRKIEPDLSARATYGLHSVKKEKKEDVASALNRSVFKA